MLAIQIGAGGVMDQRLSQIEELVGLHLTDLVADDVAEGPRLASCGGLGDAGLSQRPQDVQLVAAPISPMAASISAALTPSFAFIMISQPVTMLTRHFVFRLANTRSTGRGRGLPAIHRKKAFVSSNSFTWDPPHGVFGTSPQFSCLRPASPNHHRDESSPSKHLALAPGWVPWACGPVALPSLPGSSETPLGHPAQPQRAWRAWFLRLGYRLPCLHCSYTM